MHDEALELAKQFQDEEYRRAWAEDFMNTALALQIAVLRRERGWKQKDLAERASTTQSAISRMEDVEYGAHSLSVLKQLASAFGLRLKVSFEEFGTLIEESAVFNEAGLRRSSFDQDRRIAGLLGVPENSTMEPVSPPLSFESSRTADEGVSVQVSFSDQMMTALKGPLDARVLLLKKWVLGYGLPFSGGPVYRTIYFAIPATDRHGELVARLAEACAGCLSPETFGELLADPDDGEQGAVNLLRLAAMLRAGYVVIHRATGMLLNSLRDHWSGIPLAVQDAVVDLVLDLADLSMMEAMLAWADLDEHHRLQLDFGVFDAKWPRSQPVATRLADELHDAGIRRNNDPLAGAISSRVIELITESSSDKARELSMNERSRITVAVTRLNSYGRDPRSLTSA